MTYLLLGAILLLLHLLLKMNWTFTFLAGAYLFLMLGKHRKLSLQADRERHRFYEAVSYLDTILYSFAKEGKVDRALWDVVLASPEGDLKETVREAYDHLMMTFDDSEVLRDALAVIERRYSCKRIRDVHEFMQHVEYYGGETGRPVELLLADKNNWEMRTKKVIQERQHQFTEIALSVATSLAICGMILYLPVMDVDISNNLLVQMLTLLVLILDDGILLWGQKYLAVDYLKLDLLENQEGYAKKLEEYRSYNGRKAIRLSLALGIPTLALAGFWGYMGALWKACLSLFLALFFFNQHKIGHALQRRSLNRHLRSAFPNWLLDLVLLLQSENVQMALEKSMAHVPPALQKELELLLDGLALQPESSEPYHSFLKEFAIPEVSSTMSMLYSLSVGNSANAGKQVAELIEKNQQMLALAEEERMKNKSSGMYLLFLAPVLSASLKLVVDMAMFMLTFLARGF